MTANARRSRPTDRASRHGLTPFATLLALAAGQAVGTAAWGQACPADEILADATEIAVGFSLDGAIGDVSGDGLADFVVAGVPGSAVTVLINDGTGGLGAPTNYGSATDARAEP